VRGKSKRGERSKKVKSTWLGPMEIGIGHREETCNEKSIQNTEFQPTSEWKWTPMRNIRKMPVIQFDEVLNSIRTGDHEEIWHNETFKINNVN
jgi:hypothetical protein